MTFLSLKAVATFISTIAFSQAIPLAGLPCSGDACNQNVNSGSVSLGSTTNIAPITNITPVTRYQPIVRTFAPIVQSYCRTGYESACGNDFGDFGDNDYLDGDNDCSDIDYFDSPSSGIGNLNRAVSSLDNYAGGIGQLGNSYNRIRMFKRDDNQISDSESDVGNPLFGQLQSDSCQAGQQGSETSIPDQNVDLGSQVEIQPSNQVFPSTTYQDHVQALDADIQAADAQDSTLSQQNVNLGSNVNIQPSTHVVPQTTYQPSVSQLTTSIQAEPQQDQSLPQSSVQLGSNVNIAPNVLVQPLTTFQPSITSLPFIINAEPCNTDASSFPLGSDDYLNSLPADQQSQDGFQSPMIQSGNFGAGLLGMDSTTSAAPGASQLGGVSSDLGCF